MAVLMSRPAPSINLHDAPEKISIDKSGANTAAIESVKADACVDILIRQNKYLSNIVEQDHRAVTRATTPTLNFKSFRAAKCVLAGVGRALKQTMLHLTPMHAAIDKLMALIPNIRAAWASHQCRLT